MHYLIKVLLFFCFVFLLVNTCVYADSHEPVEQISFEIAFPDFHLKSKPIEYEGMEYLAFDKENSVLLFRLKKAYNHLRTEYRALERVTQLEEEGKELQSRLSGKRKELLVTQDALIDLGKQRYDICEESRRELKRELLWGKIREALLVAGLGAVVVLSF